MSCSKEGASTFLLWVIEAPCVGKSFKGLEEALLA